MSARHLLKARRAILCVGAAIFTLKLKLFATSTINTATVECGFLFLCVVSVFCYHPVIVMRSFVLSGVFHRQ